MLEPRLYRAAWLPLLLALVVAGFSLHARARPLATTLAPDAFDGDRATATLEGLVAAFPARRPGSPGDDALADRVRDGFVRSFGHGHVRERTFQARTVDGERTLRTVIASRPGRLEHQIVVMAHRDALARGSKAELSATAALLELAEVFAGRVTRHTLTLVSTSGGTGGSAGAADFATHHGGPVDAVVVLGDLASTQTRKPWVVPWSNARGAAPLRLQRTAELALRTEAGAAPGGSSPLGQVLRQAFPLTVSEQGPLNAAGLPAVLVGPSGELGPPADAATSPDRMRTFGRAALRTVTALDNGNEIPPVKETGIVLRGQVLPAWAVRLVGAALLLPALLAAIDGFFRVRRRKEHPAPWMAWALAGALPFLIAGLFAVVLRAIGLLGSAPSAPVAPGHEPVEAGAVVAVLLALAAGWWVARLWAVRRLGLGSLGRRGDPSAPAAGVALTAILVIALVWLRNPFSGALLILAAHAWLLALAPETRPRRGAVALVVLGLAPLALALVGYAIALHAGPVGLVWISLLAVAGGHVSPLGVLLGSLVLGCAASVLVVVLRTSVESPQAPEGPPRVVSRGPLTYAGPGSLGGTKSAIRR